MWPQCLLGILLAILTGHRTVLAFHIARDPQPPGATVPRRRSYTETKKDTAVI